MPMVVRFTNNSFGDLVEEGEYLAVCENVEDVTNRTDKNGNLIFTNKQDGSSQPTVQFSWRVLEGERVDSVVTATASLFVTTRSKLYEFLQGFGVVPETITEGLDLESLKGKVVRVYVENKEGASGLRSRVTKVKQPKGEQEAAPQVEAPAPVAQPRAVAPVRTAAPAPVRTPAPALARPTPAFAPKATATVGAARPPFGFPAKKNPFPPVK